MAKGNSGEYSGSLSQSAAADVLGARCTKRVAQVLEDLKGLYKADSEDAAQEAFKFFKDHWKALYPRVIHSGAL